MLQSIRAILVEALHIGNMGSVAHVMKIMGLTNLWLVSPLIKPGSQTMALAVGVGDAIDNVQIVDIFNEALVDCNLVAGTSTYSRTLP